LSKQLDLKLSSSIWLDRERHVARRLDTYEVAQTEIHGLLRIPVRRIPLFLKLPFRASSAGTDDANRTLTGAEAGAACQKEAANRAAQDDRRILEAEHRRER
jgi:hypothetical protein